MIYRQVLGERISMLGFGCMRLPVREGEIDVPLTRAMIDRAMEAGINYYDTAYPYHGGKSEIVVAEALSHYPRESYYLADKYPGHQVMSEYNPAEIFEDQLAKCGVDYFDFYLLHNVNEKSIETYRDKRWGIVDYFVEQKRLGRIKHLGFSTHARVEGLREFLAEFGDRMEFCQIQLNYLDWSLQRAEEKCAILAEYGIPVFVMEPVRGGKLATLPDHATERLAELRPGASAASFAFRWFMSFDNIGTVLSGMSTPEQLEDNVRTFDKEDPLTDEENEYLLHLAEGMKKSVPCTACGYCKDVCPMGLDIPMFMATYNELSYERGVNSAIHVQSLPKEKQPNACITCQRCVRICPQNIDVPLVIHSLCRMLDEVPNWEDICRRREEAARKLKGKKD